MSETTAVPRPLAFSDDDETSFHIAHRESGGSTPYSFTIVPNGRLRDSATLAIDVYGLALLRQWIDEALAHAEIEEDAR